MLRLMVSFCGPIVFFGTSLVARTLLLPPDLPTDFVESIPVSSDSAEPVTSRQINGSQSLLNSISLKEFYPHPSDETAAERFLSESLEFIEKSISLNEKSQSNANATVSASELESIFSNIDERHNSLSSTSVAEFESVGSGNFSSNKTSGTSSGIFRSRSGFAKEIRSLLSLDGSASVKSLQKLSGQDAYPVRSDLGSSPTSAPFRGGASNAWVGTSSNGGASGNGSGLLDFGVSRSARTSSSINEFIARQQISSSPTSPLNSLDATSSLVSTSSRPQLKPDGKFGIPNAQYWTFDFKDNDADGDIDVNDARNHFRAYTTSLEPLLQSARQVVKYSPTELNSIFDDLNSQIPTTPAPRSPSYLTFMIIEFPVKGFYLPRTDIPTNPGLPPGGLD